MDRVRGFYSRISINKWLLVGAIILIASLGGNAIISGQKYILIFVILPFGLLVIASISSSLKLFLLALSIPLALVQIPSLPIPYGFSICEIILMALTADEVFFMLSDYDSIGKTPMLKIIIPLGLFALAALITALKDGDINSWHTYCLMPLLWFFLASRKIHDREEAWLFVKISLLTIVGFIVIVEWAIATGHFVVYDPLYGGSNWRLADGIIVAIGPIRLVTFAIRMGAIAALGLPACIILWLANKGKIWWRIGALLMMAGFGYVLILSSGRGAVVAAILGLLLVLLISGRFRSPIFLVAAALSLIVLALWGKTILNLLPIANIQRLLTLLQGVQSIDNFNYRMNALALAWKLTLQNPLGVGFGYLDITYQIDDAIIYAYILEGTGIIGSVAFIMITLQMTSEFALFIFKSLVGSTRDLAAIGLSTLIVGLVAGISSQSIMFEPVHAFVFWAMVAVCYRAVQIPKLGLLAEIKLDRQIDGE